MSRKERDKVLGHADDNDGIEEYDNPMPDWWVGLFIVCIVFAFGYTLDYHFVSGRSQVDAYAAELDDAAIRWPVKAATGVLSEVDLLEGKAIYDGNCVGCHGPELKGGIGPDLTDAVWIHGGAYDQVVTVVTNGVPEKGMITWGPILGPQKIAKVSGFILSKNESKPGATE